MAALNGGNFTDAHLDSLYSIVEAPLRAAATFHAANIWRQGARPLPLSDIPVPMMNFRIVLAYLHDPEIHGDLQDAWQFQTPVNVRDWTAEPLWDARRRVRRGLLQRLVDHHGLETLRAQMPHTDDRDFDPSFLPILSQADGTRMTTIDSELGESFEMADLPLLMWSDETGAVKPSCVAEYLDKTRQLWTERLAWRTGQP